MNNMFRNITPVVKNLIIINVLMFIATVADIQLMGRSFSELMAGHYYQSPLFEPWQIITHMFMHGGMSHLFFNMFGLFMFGPRLESKYGSKRFLQYFMLTGLGAFFLHYLVVYFQLTMMPEFTDPQFLEFVQGEGAQLISNGENYTDLVLGKMNALFNVGVVGASGALFGILLAYGMTYPNDRIMLMFPPIPIKAKYFVLIYGAFELFMGISNNAGDNTAHFAHLGGMLFGYILIKIWNKGNNDYEQYY